MTNWRNIQQIVERLPESSLGSHGVHLIAAAQWRQRGIDVPTAYQEAERVRAIQAPAALLLIERVRATVPGPIVLMKGPELALRYPNPALRPFGDLDLLVQDAELAQQLLVDREFERAGNELKFRDKHHRAPLSFRSLPLTLELHDNPGWLSWMTPASPTELFAEAIPSSLGMDGIMTLAPHHHALFIAAHAWRHGPLGCLIHLIDLVMMTKDQDPDELAELAECWGMGPVWRSSVVAIEALFDEAPAGNGFVRYWITQLRDGHVRNMREHYVGQLLAPLWAPTMSGRVAGEIVTIRDMFAPRPDQEWRDKLLLGRRVVANRRKTLHEYLSDG